MGTRNLTAVMIDGEYKVAQYGQWDGYPSGVGATVLAFLQRANLQKFAAKVRASRKAEEGESDVNLPQFHRDTGGNILRVVADAPAGIALPNNLEFAADSLFCEWAYVVDLDKQALEVFKGFNREPLDKSERFYGLKTSDKDVDAKYHPVRFVRAWALSDLPSKEAFIKALERDEEE